MVKVDRRQVLQTIQKPGGQLDREIRAIAETIRRDAEREWQSARASGGSSGAYERGFFDREARPGDISLRGVTLGYLVGNSDPKANWIEYGTGIHGPYQTPVVAVKGRPMTFVIDGEWISTYQTKGRKATATITKAAEEFASNNAGATWVPRHAAITGNRPRPL